MSFIQIKSEKEKDSIQQQKGMVINSFTHWNTSQGWQTATAKKRSPNRFLVHKNIMNYELKQSAYNIE